MQKPLDNISMADIKDMLPADFDSFSQDADYLWNSILKSPQRNKADQEQFVLTLERCISYLNALKIEQIKAICLVDDMAEKVSMIIDLKDYVYQSLIDEWNNTLS
jgi:hypothetical protein